MTYGFEAAMVVFVCGGVLVLERRGWDGWWIAAAFGLAAIVMAWCAAVTA